MSYQAPSFAFLSVYRDEADPATNIGSVAAPDTSLTYLYDDLGGPLTIWASSTAVRTLEIDRGTGSLANIDRLIVPAGHNLDGGVIAVFDADNAAFTVNKTTLLSYAVPDTAQIDQSVTNGTRQFLRIEMNPMATKAVQCGEIFLTEDRTLTRGPDPGWRQPIIDNVLAFESPAGVESARVLGADRQTYEIVFRGLEGADLTIVRDLWTTCGTHSAFYFTPPDDAFSKVRVKLAQRPDIDQDVRTPSGGTMYRYRLSMIEALG